MKRKQKNKVRRIRIGLAQINPTVGDLEGNAAKIRRYIKAAKAKGVQILAFPELAVSGYPPEDLLLKPSFLEDCKNTLVWLAREARGIAVLVGAPEAPPAKGEHPYNSCFVLYRGKVAGVYRKINLPNYGVFDEKRYFQPGDRPTIVRFGDLPVGLSICEDAWVEDGPIPAEANQCGAELAFSISASPYHKGKGIERERLMQRRAKESGCFLAYTNLVGGQDELVFDGDSMVATPDGKTIARGRAFEEELIVADISIDDPRASRRNTTSASLYFGTPSPNEGLCDFIELPALPENTRRGRASAPAPRPGGTEEVYRALVLGTRDYVTKNGFRGVIIGLSGGIDSALTTAVAVDALGPEMVHTVTMPSEYTSSGTLRDARRLAENLGVELIEIPITPIFSSFLDSLAQAFKGRGKDVTEENIQARIRGTLLMALSNKFGWMVLATGNKSEFAVGYCTLYGDMAGGFAVLKDVPKTLVYPLCRYRNRKAKRTLIPRSIIKRRPSAELRPDQFDEESLPPYPVLDRIIELYVERDLSFDEIVASGLDDDTVARTILMIDRNEYKRRQGPPGVKITPKAFGRDRRLPITNRYNPVRR